MFVGDLRELGKRDEHGRGPSTSTTPLTSETSNVLPSVGEPGAGSFPVVNVTSGPNVVPALFVATSRDVVERVRHAGWRPDADHDVAREIRSDGQRRRASSV